MAEKKDFSKIGFEDFRRMASDVSLTKYERIGFPDSYRQGHEAAIFVDIQTKLPTLNSPGSFIVDIGPGCSDLPVYLIEHCREKGHHLALVDSAEMLAQLPNATFIQKLAALFPECSEFITEKAGKANAVICYSVLHYAFIDTALYRFFDSLLALLAPGGRLLIGDIPNASMRKRFFASETGVRFHQQFMGTQEKPTVNFNQIEVDQIDDAVLTGLVQRARAAGYHAWLLPQAPGLPMANRREDLLIERP